MDGNFSAEHMRHRTTERDVSLSSGMAFMAHPDQYKAHLQSAAEIAQVFDTYIKYLIIINHWSDSPAHATHTKLSSKQILVARI
jgi:hypothetical protein